MVGLAIANRSELPVALVTGAAGGMGSALSRLLGQTHFLVLSDANPDRLSQAGQLLEDEGYQLSCIAGDLADPSLAQALAETCSENGALRSVVNAAGLSPAQASWRDLIRANTQGAVCLLDAIEPLVSRRTACVLIASVAGHLAPSDPVLTDLMDRPLVPELYAAIEPRLQAIVSAQGGTMEGHAYSFSKQAVIRLCEKRAIPWGIRKARIVSLSPGVVWTAMGRREAQTGKRAQAMAEMTPAGRWGTAMDVARVAEFVLSDAASYVTGCDIRVDGGAVAAMRGKAF